MLTVDQIKAQLQHCLLGTSFDFLGERIEGKVRESYLLSEKERVIVVSDRLSAFDRVVATIPFKGQVLNQMAKFWFEETKDIVNNHVISFPDPNVTVAKECKVLPIEFIVRGYLTGSSSTAVWTNYEKGVRDYCGNQLPDGMIKNQKFAEPIVTPTTKAEKGEHDELISRQEIIDREILTAEVFDKVAAIALKLYQRGVEIAAKQGIILVDTKYEFGVDENGEIVAVDEIHTPDSSRFWYADEYQQRFEAGEPQKKIDKEYVRLWLKNEKNFVGDGEVPTIDEEVKIEAARRYIEAYELITGQTFAAEVGEVEARVEKNLRPLAK